MELLKGRPESAEGRLDKEMRVYDLLDSLGVEYDRVDHEAAMTMEACDEIDRVLEELPKIVSRLRAMSPLYDDRTL